MTPLDMTRDSMIRALSPSLESQLAAAERDLMCAQRIDNWQRCQRETAAAQARISEIRKQMEARDAR